MPNAAEALQVILESVSPVQSERRPLSYLYGRVIAADITAPHDVPQFDNSSMDGYAIRAEDAALARGSSMVSLSVQGEIPAGVSASTNLSPLRAIRVMTGAPIPAGADAVIEQELVVARNGSVSLAAPVPPGKNIRKRGEDIREGSVVMTKGTRLKSVHVGVLASLGILEAEVYRRPTVAFLTTGNEIVDVQKTPLPGQIRDSNAYLLMGLIREVGSDAVNLGTAPDTEEELKGKINQGLSNDALITSGGASVGDYDLVLKVLKSLGVEMRFWKVNIKPGMPMAFGISKSGAPVFALPGNPVSTVVTFLQFAVPGLHKRAGVMEPEKPVRLKATLEEPIRKSDSKRHFVRGVVRNEKAGLAVHTTGSQSSGVLTSLTKANCFIILPEESGGANEGEEVEIELI